MIFKNADEVALVFGLTLTGNQWLMVENYLRNGIRPEAGCTWCDTGYIRSLTGDMDNYDAALGRGEVTWPYEIPTDQD